MRRANQRTTGQLKRRTLFSAVTRPLAITTGIPYDVATAIRFGQTSSSISTITEGRTRVSAVRIANEKSSGKRNVIRSGYNSRARASPVCVVLLTTSAVPGERRCNSAASVRLALISPNDTP